VVGGIGKVDSWGRMSLPELAKGFVFPPSAKLQRVGHAAAKGQPAESALWVSVKHQVLRMTS
jgi:hypothetical protein